jgi:ABC-2 type transport system ATP-binding protein
MAGLHAAFLFNANYLGGIIVTFTLTFIYAATLLAAWMTGVTVRFARTEKSNYGAYIISLSIVIVILVFFAIANIDDLWIKYSIYITFSMLLYLTAYFHLRKNVEQLLEMAFEPLNYVTTLKINRKVSASGSVPMFLQKELRMCFRSKRIRLLFFIVPIYAVAVSIGLFLKGNIQGFIFMPYLVTTALAMNYNEYWERYWAWDRQSHGLIFSVPAGKWQYFMQKISCLFLFGATVLPVHILFFWDNVFVGVIGGLLLLSAVSIFTSYDSMSNPNLNADLNDSIWKSQLGIYLDESFMFDYYSVFEHFEFMISAWKVDGADFKHRLNKYEPVFSLEQYYGHRISTLSSGNKKKTGLMETLLVNPKVLIWDEPFSGLDPGSQERLKQLINEHKRDQRATFVISSHDLNHIAEICDEVVILDGGRIVDRMNENITYDKLKNKFIESTLVVQQADCSPSH